MIVLVGDGGILFTIQELATAVEEALAIPIVLWNNDSLAMIQRRHDQARDFSDWGQPQESGLHEDRRRFRLPRGSAGQFGLIRFGRRQGPSGVSADGHRDSRGRGLAALTACATPCVLPENGRTTSMNEPCVRAEQRTVASAVPKMRVDGRCESVVLFDSMFFDPSLKTVFSRRDLLRREACGTASA